MLKKSRGSRLVSLSIIFIIVFGTLIFIHDKNSRIFRNIKWGMSAEEIIKSERKMPDAKLIDRNILRIKYSIDFYGANAEVEYMLGSKEELDSIFIGIKTPIPGCSDFKCTMASLKSIYNKKYGETMANKELPMAGEWLTSDRYILFAGSTEDGIYYPDVVYFQPRQLPKNNLK